MEKLYELLKNCCPTVDFQNESGLVTNKVIDSMDLVAIISDIEEEFDVSIEMDKIEPENFDSAEAMWKLIQSLK
jgi:acyl carrier protein